MIQTNEELHQEFVSVQNLYALSASLPAADDEIRAIDKLLKFKQARKEENRKHLRIFKHIAGYAAAISLAILSTWMIMDHQYNMAMTDQLAFDEFSTPSGQRAKIRLHDGTVVWLNARSSLRYPNRFLGDERKVELDGEAFFEVAHNEKSPFVVSTGKADIKVLGTKFNVFAYKERNEFVTALIEGSIKLYKPGQESSALFINPNECALLKDDHFIKSRINSIDFLLWKDGIYAFDDEPFSRIIAKLELYYDIKIDVRNKQLKGYKFSGKFRQRDGVENVLKTLQKIYKFSYMKDEESNKITIY